MSKQILSMAEQTFAKHAMVLVVLSTLVACKTVGPDYSRPEAALPSNYTEAVGHQSQSLQAIDQRWWETYQDAQLNHLVELALKKNTDIKLTVAKIEEVEAYARQVGAASLPSVSADVNASRQRLTQTGRFPVFGPNPVNDFNAQLSASFEIDFWGKLKRSRESARAQLLASHYAQDTAKLSLIGLVTQQYFTLSSLDAKIVVVKDTLISFDKSLALTKRRLEGGVASGLDVHQAEVTIASLKAQLSDLEREKGIALHQLATLTGMLDLKAEAKSINALPVPPVPPAGLPSTLMESRPDIKQAEANLIAANANIGNAKAALYPSVSLTASYGRESLELSDIVKSASRIWTGGLAVSLPIFNAGQLNAKVDQVTAQQKQALIGYEASLQTAFQEVNDALVNLRQHSETELMLNDGLIAAKKAVAISENRYESGYSAYLEVLDAQRTYYDVALTLISSRQARLQSSVALYKALGGGWQDTYINVSQQ